ncbi:Uncharacterized protein PPKH_3160 [Pseudomonas putida]|nr:Uncharacterized protein PPKH_3160 [Pseudomonas putida]
MGEAGEWGNGECGDWRTVLKGGEQVGEVHGLCLSLYATAITVVVGAA